MIRRFIGSAMFRNTFRPLQAALLARGEPGSPEEIAAKAEQHAIAALNVFVAFDRRFADRPKTH